MISEEQRKARKNYIGGSDVGAILGKNKYKTALDVYFEKVEGIGERIDNTYTYWGNILESTMRKTFSDLTAFKVEEPRKTKFHKEYPFLAANIDGLIFDELNKPYAILEIKTVHSYQGRAEWGEENHNLGNLYNNPAFNKNNGLKNTRGFIPSSYLYQCALYAAVYELPYVYIATYFGGDLGLKVYLYERDIDFENEMIGKLVDFWEDHVQKENPPHPVDGNETKKLYKIADLNKIITSTDTEEELYYELQTLLENEKDNKSKIADIKNQLMQYMGFNEIMISIGGDKLCTWKNVTSNRFDLTTFKKDQPEIAVNYIKENFSRRFNICKLKEQ